VNGSGRWVKARGRGEEEKKEGRTVERSTSKRRLGLA